MKSRFLVLVAVLIGLSSQFSASPAFAQLAQQNRGARDVFAQATCTERADGGQTVDVMIKNQYGAPIEVVFVEGYASGRVPNPSFALTEQPLVSKTIADGESLVLTTEVAVDYLAEGTYGGAFVVTTAGLLMPQCEDEIRGLLDTPNSVVPKNDEQTEAEAIETAIKTIGQLESWHLYPGLYALVHPDVQALVPYAAVACSMKSLYSRLDGTELTVYSTEMTDYTIQDWTWEPRDIAYQDVVEVNYTQRVGTMISADLVDASMHLKDVDGVYRWFLGGSPQMLDQPLPTCGF
jgi:hypothetical protein